MTELRDFENELRATFADVVTSAEEPSGLADRLVAGATQRRAPHRAHPLNHVKDCYFAASVTASTPRIRRVNRGLLR